MKPLIRSIRIMEHLGIMRIFHEMTFTHDFFHFSALASVFIFSTATDCFSITQGPLSGQNAGDFTTDVSYGTNNWTLPEYAMTSNNFYADGDYVDNATFTHYLKVLNCGFSIPGGNQIDGIEVSVEGRVGLASLGFDVACASVRLVKGGVISGNDVSDLGVNHWDDVVDNTYLFGGSTSKWGLTWTLSDINASNFGVVVSVGATNANIANVVVDYVGIKVFYSPIVAPLNLLYFKAETEKKPDASGEMVQLSWNTTSEINLGEYIIERSGDGNNYEAVGKVDPAGNISGENQYSVMDLNPTHTFLYYRLTATDNDGKSWILGSREISLHPFYRFGGVVLYPNPAQYVVSVSIEIPDNRKLKTSLVVFNILGEKMYELDAGFLEEGLHRISFDIKPLHEGMYFISVRRGEDERQVPFRVDR